MGAALVDGKFEQSNGWTFNDLTYLPSPKTLWVGNPLASTNTWKAESGTTWRTECNTAQTGRNGCRSYTWAKSIVSTTAAKGTTYSWMWDWRFNNIVQLS